MVLQWAPTKGWTPSATSRSYHFPVLLRIITHLDDSSATQLALGGSCARGAVIAHANVAYVSALHRLEARTGWPDTPSVDMSFVSVSVSAGFSISYHISCDHCDGPADAA